MSDHTLRKLTVTGVNQQENKQALLSMHTARQRLLEIPVGMCEGLAIQMALTYTIKGRPMTHDLILNVLGHLGTSVDRVIIDDVSKGIYYARVILSGPNGPVTLDCRPSDGVALALRASAPIYASESVLQKFAEDPSAE